jgi:hypothetical protein
LLAGRKMETREQKRMVILAADLYIQIPGYLQTDFFMQLLKVPHIFKIFSDAILANFMIHEIMEKNAKESSGLTPSHLQLEKSMAMTYQKYTQ